MLNKRKKNKTLNVPKVSRKTRQLGKPVEEVQEMDPMDELELLGFSMIEPSYKTKDVSDIIRLSFNKCNDDLNINILIGCDIVKEFNMKDTINLFYNPKTRTMVLLKCEEESERSSLGLTLTPLAERKDGTIPAYRIQKRWTHFTLSEEERKSKVVDYEHKFGGIMFHV